MHYKLLVLTLIFTAASALLGSKSSASASATARADDPANRARPETDTKAGEADMKIHSITPGVSQGRPELLMSGLQCHIARECCATKIDGYVCPRLQYEADQAFARNNPFQRERTGGISSMRYPMFYQCEPIALAILWQALEPHSQLPKDIVKIVQEYTPAINMYFQVRFVYGQGRTYLARFNLDTERFAIEATPITTSDEFYQFVCKKENISSPTHPHAPYVTCISKTRNSIPCEHMYAWMVMCGGDTVMHEHAPAWTAWINSHAEIRILDGKLLRTGSDNRPRFIRFLAQNNSTGVVLNCSMRLCSQDIESAQPTDRTKLS